MLGLPWHYFAFYSVKGCEEAKAELDGWGLQLEDDIMTINGRTLPIENIIFGRGYKSSAGPTAEWSRDATGKCVLKAVDVTVSSNSAIVASFLY